MTAADLPAMELTRSTLDGTHDFICREHAVTRTGLAERHALNVEAKHLREHHTDRATLEVNLSAAARYYVNGGLGDSLWAALGLTWVQAHALANAPEDVLAYVSPL